MVYDARGAVFVVIAWRKSWTVYVCIRFIRLHFPTIYSTDFEYQSQNTIDIGQSSENQIATHMWPDCVALCWALDIGCRVGAYPFTFFAIFVTQCTLAFESIAFDIPVCVCACLSQTKLFGNIERLLPLRPNENKTRHTPNDKCFESIFRKRSSINTPLRNFIDAVRIMLRVHAPFSTYNAFEFTCVPYKLHHATASSPTACCQCALRSKYFHFAI